MRTALLRAFTALLVAGSLSGASAVAERGQAPSPFAAQIAALSEPAGYFESLPARTLAGQPLASAPARCG